MSDEQEPSITYTVRDILQRIEGKVDDTLRLLGGKADHSDVAALFRKFEAVEQRVDNVDMRLTSVEQAREDDASRQEKQRSARVEWRRWIIPLIITTALWAWSIWLTAKG